MFLLAIVLPVLVSAMGPILNKGPLYARYPILNSTQTNPCV